MEIYSENLQRKIEIDTEVYRRAAEEILSSLIGPEGEGSVGFVSDGRIRALNRDYRRVDRPTDVLSFSFAGDPFARGVVGDVFISAETAAAQAAERGAPVEEELLRLLIHGLLHLAGHTHDAEKDGGRMRALEDELFRSWAPRVVRPEANGRREGR